MNTFLGVFQETVNRSSSVDNLIIPAFQNFRNLQGWKLQFVVLQFTKKELHYRTFPENFPAFSKYDCNWTNTQPFGQTGQNDWAVFWVLICMVHLTVCSCHVTYMFQSESTLYSCLSYFKKYLRYFNLSVTIKTKTNDQQPSMKT